jgi:hypothetical protein
VGRKFLKISEPDPDWNQRFGKLIVEAKRHFESLPEEDQILSNLASKISFVYGQSSGSSKEAVARSIIESSLGSRFAKRVLANPQSRKKLGLG